MKFGQIELLNLLWLLIPLFLFLRWAWWQRTEALKKFGNIELIERLMEGVSRDKQRLKLYFIFFVFGMSLLSLARPMWGEKEQQLNSRGHDIIIALDVSKSMYAEDIKPNRMLKAKQEISALFNRMEGNRIGLVIFGGEAFLQCPLTLDYSAAKILLSEVEVGAVPVPGTALTSAIKLSVDSFPETGERDSQSIILITDGEDTYGESEQAAGYAIENGVLVYAIGIGDPVTGVPIPIRDEAGSLDDYVKDTAGEIVTTRLDEEALRSMCLKTGGAYFTARPDSFELDEIYNHMNERRKEQLLQSRFFSQYEERYQYFLFIALALLLIEMLMSDRKKAPERSVGGYRHDELNQDSNSGGTT